MKERIHAAYKGEIYGVSFFSCFAKNYADKSHSQLWEALIHVEVLTAKLLESYLDKHAIEYDKHDTNMQQKGIKDAEIWVSLPWDQLVQTLTNWVEPYEYKYRLWAEEAKEDTQAFNLIADHETAIFQCWKAEMIGKSGVPVLLRFIKQYSTA
ncbi:hypothetical protein L4D77_13435 [Photobacterium frigidiphilum]|uniref:hypothetical protein n=1 Tax=Photobacterium frigidiphilum TaxID=264736 RepID=UPI003D09A58F